MQFLAWKYFCCRDFILDCLASAVAPLRGCFPRLSLSPRRKAEDVAAAPRWYRVHQVDGLRYYVRRDVGPQRHVEAPDACAEPKPCTPLNTPHNTDLGFHHSGIDQPKVWKVCSVPAVLDRGLGLVKQGFDCDAFNSDCRVCLEAPVEVIALPCRHGGLCASCFRKALFSRPVHRGGHACPFCRCRIRGAVQLHHEVGAAVQYGYFVEVK